MLNSEINLSNNTFPNTSPNAYANASPNFQIDLNIEPQKITPVVLSYNHPNITEKCLLSLLKCKPVHISDEQVILLHNGSEKKHVVYLQEKFPNITHKILEKNLGFAGGANNGINSAFEKSNWCLFITNDVHLLTWPKSPEVPSLVGPLTYFRKVGNIDCTGGVLSLVNAKPAHVKSVNDFNKSFKAQFQYPYIPGSIFLIHKNVFTETQGFNEKLGTYWEDIDLSVRYFSKGGLLKIDTDFQALHMVGKTCHKDSYYTTYLYQRNRAAVCRKHLSGFFLRPLLEVFLFSSWFKLAWILFRKKRWQDLSKLAAAIRDSKYIMN